MYWLNYILIKKKVLIYKRKNSGKKATIPVLQQLTSSKVTIYIQYIQTIYINY